MARATRSRRTSAVARDAYRYFGYTTTTYARDTFTKAKVLARNPTDVGVYVHSHGDFYGANDIQGFGTTAATARKASSMRPRSRRAQRRR
jgi:hypothetical protein